MTVEAQEGAISLLSLGSRNGMRDQHAGTNDERQWKNPRGCKSEEAEQINVDAREHPVTSAPLNCLEFSCFKNLPTVP